MKRMLLIVGILFAAGILLRAEPGVIVMRKDNKPVKCDIIGVDGAGTIEYELNKSKSKVKAKEYLYAKVNKPADFEKAEKLAQAGKFNDAIQGFDAILNSKYKYLGYELLATYWKALCMEKINKDAEAALLLEEAVKAELNDKSLESCPEDSKKLLSTIYIKQNQFDKALPILTELGNSSNDNLSAFSFNAGGDILRKQNKKKEAVLMYMRTALLFPASNTERKQSLKNIIAILKELNDNRYQKFEEILKKDYPGAE